VRGGQGRTLGPRHGFPYSGLGGGAAPCPETIPAGKPFFDKKALSLRSNNLIRPKQNVMGVDILRQKLIARIQQGDERYIRVMNAVSDALFESDDFDAKAYEASLKPMSAQELIARAQASNEDIEAGRVYSREEIEAALGL
jgi:hypothetical protein